jgi:glycosyltransferase involved in cell wall biosynthesis
VTRPALELGFLCQGWYPDAGGVESHTRDLTRELARRGHRIHVLCLDYSGGAEPYGLARSEVEGADVWRMAYLYHDHRALADLVRNERAERRVLEWARASRCELVHVHHATGFGLGAIGALRAAGLPVAMTLHDYWSLCPRGQMLHADGEVCASADPARCAGCLGATWPHLLPSGGGEPRTPEGAELGDDQAAAAARTGYALRALEGASRLFSPSARARELYVRAGIEAARIEVCANGIEVGGLAAEVARLREREPRSDGEVRLGVLGSVLPSKGVLELARACVRAAVPGLTLEIHGALPAYHGDPSYVEELQALAAREPGVRVHGAYRLADLPRILAGLDGVAAPSRWVEVFGLSVREAAAAGLPVLVSDAGDLPAVAAGGRAGLVVPAEDEAAWIQALRRFGGDPEARARWSRAPRELRSAAEMSDQLERAYFELLG